MKKRLLISLIVTSSVAASSIALGINSAQAGSGYKFVCQPNGLGTPTTFAITPDGSRRQLINWRSEYFMQSGYTPQRRCNEVTGRLNQYVASGNGQHITHGRMNNQPVLCVTNKVGSGCLGLLYTLKPGQDAQATLRELIELNRRNFKSYPLIEGESCRTYVDINAMIAGQTKFAEVACKAH